MSGAIEEAAKSWLQDPAYNKVFKHTFDVVEDYVCYAMMSIGAIAVTVKFLTSLGTGDVLCIIMGVSNSSLDKDLGDYPPGNTFNIMRYSNFNSSEIKRWRPVGFIIREDGDGLANSGNKLFHIVNAANYNDRCVDAALTTFMQHAPFLFLLQALLIIVAEKFFLKVPRVASRIERFYTNIVQESLFGKDPDVAEDVMDAKTNSEAISRIRRRNEVCMSLKRSSIIHQTYIIRNIIEMILLSIFIPVNLVFGIEAEKNIEPSQCILSTMEFPDLKMAPGFIHLQCEAKKVRFFMIILHCIVATQFVCFVCCAGSLLWCLGFRSISRLLKNMEKVCFQYDLHIEKQEGEDFLFLFDLLAHTSGIESTLRVLTHSDETFRKICQPRLKADNDHLKVEEDKLKVVWHAAAIEKWLVDDEQGDISVDSYDVTIFPAESIRNSITKQAKLRFDPNADDVYSAWFFDLAGGKTEYVVTIACVIGRSRMKGERIVTNLLPYGPEKPRAGMLKIANTHEVEISWEPPKGEFTKYVLSVDGQSSQNQGPPLLPIKKPPPAMNMYTFSFSQTSLPGSSNELQQSSGYRERELSNKLTSFTVTGLAPGETYSMQLKTKTGDRETRSPIFETVLTKPLPVTALTSEGLTTEKVTLKWVAPEGHPKLRAFQLLITTKDNKYMKELAVKHNANIPINSFTIEDLQPATVFQARVTTVCVFDPLKTVSDENVLTFITPPPAPRNMELDNRLTTGLTVTWETPVVLVTNQKFKLHIQNADIGYNNQYEILGERRTFNFSKLPEVVGTGEKYTVRLTYVVVPLGSDEEVESAPLIESFVTKPLAPTNFRLGNNGTNEVVWNKSLTPKVVGYRVRYKKEEDGAKSDDIYVPVLPASVDKPYEDTGAAPEAEPQEGEGDQAPEDNKEESTLGTTLVDLAVNVMYRVNIYAIVEGEVPGENIESKELHGKVIYKEDEGLSIYTEEALEAQESDLLAM